MVTTWQADELRASNPRAQIRTLLHRDGIPASVQDQRGDLDHREDAADVASGKAPSVRPAAALREGQSLVPGTPSTPVRIGRERGIESLRPSAVERARVADVLVHLLIRMTPGDILGPPPGRCGLMEDQRRDSLWVSRRERHRDETAVAGCENHRPLRAGRVQDRKKVVDERLDRRDVPRRKALRAA
jgi:hypothetical protein